MTPPTPLEIFWLFIAWNYLEREPADRTKPFQGCLIGCLAVPDGPKSRKDWLSRNRSSMEMTRKIAKDFGVCEELQRVAEEFLMSIPEDTSERLGEFTVAFCKALPEGKDVDDDLVKRWVKSRCGHDEYCYLTGSKEERRAFLSWLKRGCPAPRSRR